jgi:hypothetical protein
MLINSSIRASDEATAIAFTDTGRPTRQFPPQSRPKLAFTMMNWLVNWSSCRLTLGHLCRNFSASIGRILRAREFWCDRDKPGGRRIQWTGGVWSFFVFVIVDRLFSLWRLLHIIPLSTLLMRYATQLILWTHLGSSIDYIMHHWCFKLANGFTHPTCLTYRLLVTFAWIILNFLCKYVGLYKLSFFALNMFDVLALGNSCIKHYDFLQLSIGSYKLILFLK